MNCQIERMAQGGRGMCRIQGKVTFVQGALPGEIVDISYQKKKKDFDEAICNTVLEADPQRVEPNCPLYGQCGGCNLQHASIELQRKLKRQVVVDLFRRVAKITLPEDWPLHSGKEWNYRHRARFMMGPQGWGFRKADSHEVLPVASCPVLCSAINDQIHAFPKYPEGTELQVFCDTLGGLGFWHENMNGQQAREQIVELLGHRIHADAKVFFQSNLEMAEVLIQSVLQCIPESGQKNTAIDLFSGVGVFASFLQDHYAQVVAAEWNEGCLRHARKNLGERCKFHSSSAEDYLRKQNPGSVDFLVVDPPRAGLSAEVRNALISASPKKLVYVSCDPVTLARDLGDLIRNGFELGRVEGFDFYPQTDHLEMMALLTKGTTKNSGSSR